MPKKYPTNDSQEALKFARQRGESRRIYVRNRNIVRVTGLAALAGASFLFLKHESGPAGPSAVNSGQAALGEITLNAGVNLRSQPEITRLPDGTPDDQNVVQKLKPGQTVTFVNPIVSQGPNQDTWYGAAINGNPKETLWVDYTVIQGEKEGDGVTPVMTSNGLDSTFDFKLNNQGNAYIPTIPGTANEVGLGQDPYKL